MPRAATTTRAKSAARKKPAAKTKPKARAKASRATTATRKPAPDDPLERLRAIVLAWPETFERISHGSPTWWGGKRTFATFTVNHHGDGRVAVWCKLPPGAQEHLVESDPVVFFRPPYVGPSGWVGIRLDVAVDWQQVAGLLEEGYRTVASKRALAQLDAG